MTTAPVRDVLLRFALHSAGVTALLSLFAPMFLQLPPPMRWGTSLLIFNLGLASGVLAAVLGALAQVRFAQHLAAIDQGTASKATVAAKRTQTARLTRHWLIPHCVGASAFATSLRPTLMSHTTGVTVAIFCSLIVIAASLPLHASLRGFFVRLAERIPREVMREAILEVQESEEMIGRINRRITLAVTTPMILVAVGVAVIANSHLRRAEELSRQEAARAVAAAALEVSTDGRDVVGVTGALKQAAALGFYSKVFAGDAPASILRTERGTLQLTAPVPGGNATLRFEGASAPVLSLPSLLIALFGVVVAALLGAVVGGTLTSDLARATRHVRYMGTEQVLGGSALMERPARFRIVADLERAIQRLAARFRTFAEAQEDAIAAREASTRMRNLFFASVSHDLKGPLNSILGFTDLVRLESVTEEQSESLEAIHSRGLELLALIETILDAARVEAGQLSLMFHEEPFAEIYELALSRAGQLSGDNPMQIFDDIEPNIPPLLVDRGRIGRAIATFVAYSVRATRGGKMWVRAEMETQNLLRIDVDVPSRLHSPAELENMLAPTGSRGQRHHRGLALGLRLAKAVIELHGGGVRVIDRGEKGAMFCIVLPTARSFRQTGSKYPSKGGSSSKRVA